MINFWVSQVAETDLLTYVVKISFAVKSYNTIYKKSEFTPPLIHFLPKYYGVSREEFEKGQETAKNIQKHNLIAAVQNDKRKWRLRDWSIIIFSIIAGLVFSIINHRKESRE
jgi:hypothetical protein